MKGKAKSPGKAWSSLLMENKDVYSRSRPKRAKFIVDYMKKNHPDMILKSYHEQGAFSGKDIKYIGDLYPEATLYASDLDTKVAEHLGKTGLNTIACDAFSLPFKDNSFDITFHSGLVICFSNKDALSIIKEQVRTTSKIAFIFAHNELSWIDKLASLYKSKIKRKDIFNYRRYTEEELIKIANSIGYEAEIYYSDNALINFVGRNFGFLKRVVVYSGLADRKSLFNEIVMVIKK